MRSSLRTPPRRIGQDGFVVLGIIIGIVLALTGAVLLGMLITRMQEPPPAPPVAREVRYAQAPLEIRFGALVTARARPGHPLWIRDRGDGTVVVFESARSNRIIGFADETSLSREPIPRRSGRGSSPEVEPERSD